MLRPLLIYTAGRIAIFAVLLALLWALDLASLPGIVIALLLSVPAAYFLLGKQRGDLARATGDRRRARAALRARLRGDGDPPSASDREPDRQQDTEK